MSGASGRPVKSGIDVDVPEDRWYIFLGLKKRKGVVLKCIE